VLQGICEAMCPEYERYEREVHLDVSPFEQAAPAAPGEQPRIDHGRAVKKYHRPAAGNEAPLPEDVRPSPVLRKTMRYLVSLLDQHSTGPLTGFAQAQQFVRDRTRALRQDATLQNLRTDADSLAMHQEIARFHVLSGHRLCGVYVDLVDVRVARIFNTYGPRMSREDGRVVSEFILAGIGQGEMRVYGDGEQTRSFQYVDDLVDGLLALMDLPPSTQGDVPVVNLGNPEERTVNQLAATISSLLNTSTPIKHLPGMKDDPQRRRPDISHAKRVLGWEPSVSLEEGLRRTIEYFRLLVGSLV